MNSLTLSAGPKAFGDGAHPTTRGVLEALSMIDPAEFAPRNACDMGAGSGIISFAIIEKFGCPVVAVDVEASAVATLKENAVRNGMVTRHPGFMPGSPEIEELPVSGDTGIRRYDSLLLPLHVDGFNHPEITARGPYDLITMNILAEPLMCLAAAATEHLAPEGVMILSGILQWQEMQITQAYQSLGLTLSARLVVGDWVTLVWQE